jgi:hypothetical protein
MPLNSKTKPLNQINTGENKRKVFHDESILITRPYTATFCSL